MRHLASASSLTRLLSLGAVLLAVLSLSGCGESLAGQIYAGPVGDLRFESRTDVQWNLGMVRGVKATYDASENEVVVTLENGDSVAFVRAGDTLSARGMTLVRQ